MMTVECSSVSRNLIFAKYLNVDDETGQKQLTRKMSISPRA